MAMRLRVVSSQGKQLGDRASKVFGVHGGSIGRAADNDWILPDPERYISAHHARIEFRAGTYVLLDISTNGVYVNNDSEPLGKSTPHELQDGDRLRFGDFELLVSIDAANDIPLDESAIIAHDGRGKSAAAAKATQNDLGVELDLDSLLAADHNGESGSPYGPVDAYGQPLKSSGKRGARPRARPMITSLLDDKPLVKTAAAAEAGGDRAAPWHMSTRPYQSQKAGATTGAQKPTAGPAATDSAASTSGVRPRAEVVDATDAASAVQSLCRGAGIPASAVPAEMHGRFLQIAGQLLREMVLGLTATRQARGELKGRLGIHSSDDAGVSLPLAAGVDETLRRLLSGAAGRNVTQSEAVRAGFQEIGHHERALMEATQAALADFIQRLSPEELEERFARGTKRSSIMSGNAKARYWELYGEFFRGLTQGAGDSMPHVFIEAFARAYESSIRELDGAAGQRERVAGEGS
jgi:type VI secretion system protein